MFSPIIKKKYSFQGYKSSKICHITTGGSVIEKITERKEGV